jgi:hypothetical protein
MYKTFCPEGQGNSHAGVAISDMGLLFVQDHRYDCRLNCFRLPYRSGG